MARSLFTRRGTDQVLHTPGKGLEEEEEEERWRAASSPGEGRIRSCIPLGRDWRRRRRRSDGVQPLHQERDGLGLAYPWEGTGGGGGGGAMACSLFTRRGTD